MIRKRLVIVLALMASALVIMWAVSYHAFEFTGGLGIHDSGFFVYPRYRAQLGEVPLFKDGDYLFKVRGLPPGPLDLVLQVPGSTATDRAALTSVTATVLVSVAGSDGSQLCSAGGGFSDPTNDSGWTLTSSAASASFWSSRCQHLPISRFNTYNVAVRVLGTHEGYPHRTVIPVLQGGGNELP